MLVPAQAWGGWSASLQNYQDQTTLHCCMFFADRIILEASPRISIVNDRCCFARGTLAPINSGCSQQAQRAPNRLPTVSPGALLPFFQESGADLSKVTGVDLSAGMLSFARQRPLAETGRLGETRGDSGRLGETRGDWMK